jgi:mersacidin/lichenicidin family type 2 lantibiotic
MGELPQRTKSNSKSNETRKEKHMAKKNQKRENKPDQQPTAPATQLELSDEELEQVTGGADFNPQPDPPGIPAVTGGFGALTAN